MNVYTIYAEQFSYYIFHYIALSLLLFLFCFHFTVCVTFSLFLNLFLCTNTKRTKFLRIKCWWTFTAKFCSKCLALDWATLQHCKIVCFFVVVSFLFSVCRSALVYSVKLSQIKCVHWNALLVFSLPGICQGNWFPFFLTFR